MPIVVALRVVPHLGWHFATFPLLAGSFFLGQFLGGKLRYIWKGSTNQGVILDPVGILLLLTDTGSVASRNVDDPKNAFVESLEFPPTAIRRLYRSCTVLGPVYRDCLRRIATKG